MAKPRKKAKDGGEVTSPKAPPGRDWTEDEMRRAEAMPLPDPMHGVSPDEGEEGAHFRPAGEGESSPAGRPESQE